jgi:hypothetical protein
MFGHQFYHQTLRKYIIIFGTLFNDIIIDRRTGSSQSGDIAQRIKVPLTYAPQEKMLARLEQDPTASRKASIVLPRMSFELLGLTYAADRKMNTTIRQVKATTDKSKIANMYNPVPYDLQMQLNIFTTFAEDATYILENILPFFTPEWSVTVDLVPDIGLKYDVPVILNSSTQQDTYEGDFETRRALIWTLDFTMKGLMFGPVRKTGIIKSVNNRIFVANTAYTGNTQLGSTDLTYTINTAATVTTTNAVSIYTTPGLDANGDPTSNSSDSVAATLIDADDNYGFIVDYEEYFNANNSGT